MSKKNHFFSPLNYLLAIFFGFFCAKYFIFLKPLALLLSESFIRLLKLISLPLIFFSIVSVIANMEEASMMRRLGKKLIFYVLLTTIIAAFLALFFFKWIFSVESACHPYTSLFRMESHLSSSYLLNIASSVPDNAVNIFFQGNIVGVLFIATALGFAIFSLPKKEKDSLSIFFSSFFSAILKIPHWLTRIMPIVVWAFVFILSCNLEKELVGKDIGTEISLNSLLWYVACIVLAQCVQACVILPLFLKYKGISPWKTFSGVSSALVLAFFTKSSNAALPVVMKNSREKLHISKKIVDFAFPLCSTINMNGCAIFILITVLFVSMTHGISYSWFDLFIWVLVSTLGSISNAGVPMGGYTIAVALLTMIGVPFSLSGVILTCNALFLDMLETTVNVWSDVCIAAVLDKEVTSSDELR